jgi:hypothetical protein
VIAPLVAVTADKIEEGLAILDDAFGHVLKAMGE